MKILITGIDGLIGSALAKKLIADGHEVVGLSDGSGGGVRYKFHKADVADRDAVFSVLSREKPDITVHLAAMAHADVGPEKEAAVRRVNVDGSLNVAKAAEIYGGGKVLFFSSVKVLAENTGPGGIDEDSEPSPKGIYAGLKREVEVELLKRTADKRLSATIVRPAAVIGPGDKKGNYAKIARALRTGFFPLLDGGKARRSIVFLDRVAERVAMMVNKGVIGGRIYTFSDGDFELREIVDAIRTAKGFAFCPSIPIGPLKLAAPQLDLLLGKLGVKGDRAQNILKRLTDSFVVRTHRFEEDYGPLSPFDLKNEFEEVLFCVGSAEQNERN